MVNVVPQITIAPTTTPQIICIDGTANQMEVTFSGGTGNASYQWFSNTTNTNTNGTLISGATNTRYTPTAFANVGDFYFYVEISLDGNGCSMARSDVFEIQVIPDPSIDSQPIATQELCQNAVPTDLAVVVSGGTTSPKNYQWYVNTTNSNSGGNVINSATTDTYTPSTNTVGTFYYYAVITQPESGCAVSSEVSELKINEAPVFTIQPTPSEVCLDGTATTLTVAYQNGTGTPTYQWFSNTTDSNSDGTPITGATNASYDPPTASVGKVFYYAEISFSTGGCSKIVSDIAHVIVNQIPIIDDAEISIYSEEIFNFNPSSIIGNTVPNGTQYTWTNPTFVPNGSIIGASSAIIPQNLISQTLENKGTSAVDVTYTITPTTSKCIGNSFTLVVTVNPTITSNAIVTNINCFEANDGEISTNIEGGIPSTNGEPYLISWTGPNGFTSTDTNITNLEAGLYVLRIEDNTGFFITEKWNVTQPNLLTITKDIEKNISCFQGNDGAIEVTISGGTFPYSYNWTTTNGSGIVQNTRNQNTLTAGNYTLEIIDKNNCSTSTNFALNEPKELKIETISKQNILCFGEATGNITIDVTGGTKAEISPGLFDYLYSWTGPNSFTSTSKNIANLNAGTYEVTITDNSGCSTSSQIILNESSKIDIDITKVDVSCYGETDGSIDIAISGGVTPYQISWSNLANGSSLKNLSAGTYIANVTDGNNCTQEVTITIDQPIFFIAPAVKPISCNGENDGAIDLNLTGGIAPFSVLWSDDPSAGLQRNNLIPGTYSVIIKDSDASQCPIEQTFLFTNPAAIAVSNKVIDAIDCNSANSGRIVLDVSGGTLPYSFLWNTNATTKDLQNIPPGDYSVQITDSNGCTTTREFNIFRQEPINIELEETLITDCNLKTVNQQIKANVTGGFLPYTYNWSAGTPSASDNSIMTSNQNGSYILTITDAKGCVATKSFIVNIPSIGTPNFEYSAFALENYNFLSIEDPIAFTNLSSGNYTSVSWNFGDGSMPTNEENPIHKYDKTGVFNISLTVNYAAGCIETFERIIEITKGYYLKLPNAFTPNGDGYNETIRPVFRGFSNIQMTIYSSWGTIVYKEEGIDLKGWNGLIGGKPAENGNYVMLVSGITFFKKQITKSLPITLLK